MKRATALPSTHADEPRRFLVRLPIVITLTSLGRTTIYRWIDSGSFPSPLRLGPRTVAWRWSALDIAPLGPRWTSLR
jgi:predicted DNA-binding transcriptional regulator AlpA